MPTAPKTAATLSRSIGVLATLAPALTWAADGPVPNKGDTAWMLTSTAFVLLMSVPALALFYGGLVRTKNMLSVLMQVFVVFSLIVVLWSIYGYSLAFTEGSGPLSPFYGGLDRLFLAGTFTPATGDFSLAGTFDKATPLPELVYVAFQATFAAITCCLILGATVERIKFSAVLIAITIWFTLSYLPVAHMVWFWEGPDAYTAANVVDATNAKAGLIWQWGALDYAGGTVVHINSGVAGLVGAILLGKRIGLGKEPMPPHSLTMTMIGASLLWFGWFGFNAGSALEANGMAALAFMNTFLATAFVIGLAVGPICLWGVTSLKKLISQDDALDVFGVHAVGGITGALLTGIFNAPSLGGPGITNWVTMKPTEYPGILDQFIIQAKAVGLVFVWTAVVAFIAFKVADLIVGLRVAEEEEREGLDTTYHGEAAYNI